VYVVSVVDFILEYKTALFFLCVILGGIAICWILYTAVVHYASDHDAHIRDRVREVLQEESSLRALLESSAQIAWAAESQRVSDEIEGLEVRYLDRRREQERALASQYAEHQRALSKTTEEHRALISAELKELVTTAKTSGVPIQVIVTSKKEADLLREVMGPLTIKVSKKVPKQPDVGPVAGATALERLAEDDIEIG
jgi:ABC-type multidrug transport system fused ATPase/permease subunit